MRQAIAPGIINKNDFWQDDDFVWQKIYQSNDSELISELNSLKEKVSQKNAGVIRCKKFRRVDPEILLDHKIVQLSKIDGDFAKKLENEREHNQRGVEI